MRRGIFWPLLPAAICLLVLNALPSGIAAQVHSKPAASTGQWTKYHRDDGHTGYDPTLPPLSSVTTGWTSGLMDQEVYASPLVFNGVVYAATLNNTVYAFSQATGATLWSKNLGAPQSGGRGCGNVDPMGILGTPVIDPGTNRLYAVGEVAGPPVGYRLFGLDLSNAGNVVLNTAIAPTGFDWTIQGERGALAIAPNGAYVYVPFGGLLGDCGTYHGWIVAVPTNGSAALPAYETADSGSGLWGAGGLAIDDSTGDVLGATGNGVSSGCNTTGQNDAVVRLSPTAGFLDWFMPQDWQNSWCTNDQDLGSAGPLVISSGLTFQAGKHGAGFLLNTNNLGGVDGQLFPTPRPSTYSQALVCMGNTSDATFGGFAYAAPYIYVECEGRGLVALHLDTSTNTFTPCPGSPCPSPDWNAGGAQTFGPPIVAGGAVWVVNSSGLYAFNAQTGAQMFHSASFGVHRFVTPAEAGGQVFVPSNTVIRSFSMNFLTWTSLGGTLTSGPDASSSSTTRTDVFVRGTDNQLWYRTWNGTTWGPWTPLGGILTSDPSAVSGGANSIDVFVRGTDNGIWHRHFDGTMWAPWDPVGGIATSAPDAASWAVGRLDVIVRGTDNGLWHRAWNGTSWGAWDPAGGYATSDPSLVASGTGRIDLFVRGTNNGIWHRQGDGAGNWGAWDNVGGIATSGPDAASCSAGHLDVFIRGTDNGIWQRGFNGTSWGPWTPWGAYPTSDSSAVCQPGTTTVMFFTRGTDMALWQTTIAGS
jgi:putative pyrroloquinoline-quinone binding quinoprotein